MINVNITELGATRSITIEASLPHIIHLALIRAPWYVVACHAHVMHGSI